MIQVPRPSGSSAIVEPGGRVWAAAAPVETKMSADVVNVRRCTCRLITGRQLEAVYGFFRSIARFFLRKPKRLGDAAIFIGTARVGFEGGGRPGTTAEDGRRQARL